jgi:hypothetical protein
MGGRDLARWLRERPTAGAGASGDGRHPSLVAALHG